MTVLAYLDPGDDGGGGIGPLEILVILIVLAILILPSVFIAKYAERKGHSFIGFLLIGLLVTPIVSGIAAVVVEDRRTPRQVAVAPSSADHLDQLKKLSDLRDSGTLSPDEYEVEKARIMERRT